jgi:hypothetical protein
MSGRRLVGYALPASESTAVKSPALVQRTSPLSDRNGGVEFLRFRLRWRWPEWPNQRCRSATCLELAQTSFPTALHRPPRQGLTSRSAGQGRPGRTGCRICEFEPPKQFSSALAQVRWIIALDYFIAARRAHPLGPTLPLAFDSWAKMPPRRGLAMLICGVITGKSKFLLKAGDDPRESFTYGLSICLAESHSPNGPIWFG